MARKTKVEKAIEELEDQRRAIDLAILHLRAQLGAEKAKGAA